MEGRAISLRIGAAILVLVLAGSATLVAASTWRFRVSFDVAQVGEPVPSTRCPAGQVLVSIEGGGRAARIGRVDITMSHCIIDDPAEPDFINGEMVLTSVRDGDDAIFIEYSGTDTPTGGGTGTLEGTFTIVGGTGAYAGASGGGTLSGTSSTDGTGSGILTGTITLP